MPVRFTKVHDTPAPIAFRYRQQRLDAEHAPQLCRKGVKTCPRFFLRQKEPFFQNNVVPKIDLAR